MYWRVKLCYFLQNGEFQGEFADQHHLSCTNLGKVKGRQDKVIHPTKKQ